MKVTVLLVAVLLGLGLAAGEEEIVQEDATQAAVNSTTFPWLPPQTRSTIYLRLVGYSVPGSVGDSTEQVCKAYTPVTISTWISNQKYLHLVFILCKHSFRTLQLPQAGCDASVFEHVQRCNQTELLAASSQMPPAECSRPKRCADEQTSNRVNLGTLCVRAGGLR
jgi:hypothetical protein